MQGQAMKRKRFTEVRISGILREPNAGAVVPDPCGKHGMSSVTYSSWKAKFGGLEVSEPKRLRGLEEDNDKLTQRADWTIERRCRAWST